LFHQGHDIVLADAQSFGSRAAVAVDFVPAPLSLVGAQGLAEEFAESAVLLSRQTPGFLGLSGGKVIDMTSVVRMFPPVLLCHTQQDSIWERNQPHCETKSVNMSLNESPTGAYKGNKEGNLQLPSSRNPTELIDTSVSIG